MTTVTLTDAGKNLLRDLLAGRVTDAAIHYAAVGTGTATPAAGDTQLETEVYRQGISTFADTATAGEQHAITFIGPGQANTTIQEVGWFNGASATPGANTGVLLGRALYGHTHTPLESIQIDLDVAL